MLKLVTTSRTSINRVNTFTVIICSYSRLLSESKLCRQDNLKIKKEKKKREKKRKKKILVI